MFTRFNGLVRAFLFLLFLTANGWAQTTAFNYQGRLTEGGTPANGAFQMQFKLFDSLGGAGQIGSTLTDVAVTVTNGVFSAKLDFGANALSGANRWLEIAVRHNSSEFYTTLSPREQIASSPYAVRTLSAASADNALNLGGIPANQYVTTSTVGSSFIRNGLTTQTANFNITGDGFMGGNLALGTFNGQARLELAGTGWGAVQKITDIPSGNSLVLQAGTGNTMKVTGYNYNTNTAVPLYLSVDGANTILNSGGGNVGIGGSPAAKLTINGVGLNGYSLGVSGDAGFGGNITQTRDRGGMVKAMVYVNGNGAMIRCYNGITGSSSGNCGFIVARQSSGVYSVDFNFQVNDRFVSLSVDSFTNETNNASGSFTFGLTNDLIAVNTFGVSSGSSDRPFMLIVF